MKIFLSYAAADREYARRLRNILAEKGYDVWDEADRIAPGMNWLLEAGRALEKSDAMIVLLSPSAIKSPGTQWEIEYALGAQQFQDRLIPVLIKPTTDIPWILRRLNFIDATGDEKQIAPRVIAALRRTAASV